jgi:demethylmenaquinone methyltransferase/2-methoxy-6-polyprenyl-1,4-benzoquinol methylase
MNAMQKKAPADGSGHMFDRIAKRYDRMNRILSFGLDKGWRKRLMKRLEPLQEGDSVLDVATGTGDVAIAIARQFNEVQVQGLDPSGGMLDVGHSKVAASKLAERIRFTQGDAQKMPYEDNQFAGSCIAFGIRNVPDRVQGLKEMTRVVRPGGHVVVLELSTPRGGFMAPFARFHVRHVVPFLGGLLSGSKEYRYLQNSIEAFPEPPDFKTLMEEAGLEEVEVERLSFGSAHLYTGHVTK